MQQPSNKLTALDFAYVYEPGIGQTYQNGPYMILVGRNSRSYAVTYKGQTFSWGLDYFNEAVRACAKHDAQRRAAITQPSALAELEYIVKQHKAAPESSKRS
jgi:hypothetical protein